jgi:anhydro-N-acetylmuramic acid kinase
MVYQVIGLMSGSSLDGLDIAFTQLTEISGKWSYEILAAECIPYPEPIASALKSAATVSVPEFLKLHTSYGHYVGEQVNHFIRRHELQHKVHFIASHGHTVWHEPAARTTCQIGDGAAIAAWTLLPVVSDLRNMDIALAGQGAPIVPIADKMLFADYDFCLNLGGIANVTVNKEETLAFDICPANQILDTLAKSMGKDFDEGGQIAATGQLNSELLQQLDTLAYYKESGPKSLDNGFVHREVLPLLLPLENKAEAMHTAVTHIVQQVQKAIAPYRVAGSEQQMLVTGGGAFNAFLTDSLQFALQNGPNELKVVIPEPQTVAYKEAVAMALIGALRWREEHNVLHSVTGATRSSSGGAMWLPPLD